MESQQQMGSDRQISGQMSLLKSLDGCVDSVPAKSERMELATSGAQEPPTLRVL